MLRRYLSLALPLMLSAAVGLSYLHFRQAPANAAQDADPFAPPAEAPADPAPPAPPGDTPPPPARPAAKQAARRAAPQNDDEVQTPFLKHLLTQLDGFTEGTDEDKDAVRKMIYEADVELSSSMGPAARRKIEAANRKRSGFVVGAAGPRRATGPAIERKDVKPPATTPPATNPPAVTPPAVTPPATTPPQPVPPAEPPATNKDAFDDLFKKE